MKIKRITTQTTVTHEDATYIVREAHQPAGNTTQWYSLKRAKDGKPYHQAIPPDKATELQEAYNKLCEEDPEEIAEPDRIITPDQFLN